MAHDAKYGQVDIPGVDEDMPVFILLAKDVHAVPTLARYRNFMDAVEDESVKPTPEYMEALDQVIGTFSEYRTANPTKMKVAD